MNPDPASLDRLHDVVAPLPVPWWPPAPGWYWVLGTLMLLLVVALVRGLLSWQRNRYRREALAEWRRQETLLRDPSQRTVALAGLAELIKRTALSAFPREQVASLTGPDWLAFLDRTGSTKDFTAGPGEILEKAAYDPRTASELD
jgi:hypothetical protein